MPNESAKIILAVTNGKLSKVRDALAVEGTINALKCGFQFRTQDWDGTTKTAVFVRGRATPSTTNADITYVILDENNELIEVEVQNNITHTCNIKNKRKKGKIQIIKTSNGDSEILKINSKYIN